MSEAERKVGDSLASSQPDCDDNLVARDEYLVVVASVQRM